MPVGPFSIAKGAAFAVLTLVTATPSSGRPPPVSVPAATTDGNEDSGQRLVCRRYFGCVPPMPPQQPRKELQ